MAAHGIKSSVYILPNPHSSEVHHRDLNNITVAQRNLTFRLDITRDILTLWLGPAQPGDDISGLAYVPTIDHSSPCYHGHVPENATQFDDLPSLNFDLIGYAPWVSKNCSRRFLDSAAADKGNTRAVVFYTITNGSKSAAMPTKDDRMWDIGPHGYQFPIYAINGVDGEPLMEKIAKYSRNITDIWDSPGLKDKYDIRDYARVYIEVDTGLRNPLPGLWLFLLIVLGVVIFVFGFTSMVMHWIQYRHRVALQRRLASGEVDLEAMGVKRLTVPLVILRKFPMRTYQGPPCQSPSPEPHTTKMKMAHSRTPSTVSLSQNPRPQTPPPKGSGYATPSPPLPPSPTIIRGSEVHSTVTTTMPTTPLPTPPSQTTASLPDIPCSSHAFTQTNCVICLEEFESGVCTVRELPCLHIFHPQCIDAHLTANSSLCPLCKVSTLPRGYVPAHLSNQTVQRERNMRRMRERHREMSANGGAPVHRIRRWMNVFALPSYVASRMGAGGDRDRGTEVRGDGHGQAWSRSFSEFASVAPTQEEEEEEWRNMSLLRRLLKQAFPR